MLGIQLLNEIDPVSALELSKQITSNKAFHNNGVRAVKARAGCAEVWNRRPAWARVRKGSPKEVTLGRDLKEM